MKNVHRRGKKNEFGANKYQSDRKDRVKDTKKTGMRHRKDRKVTQKRQNRDTEKTKQRHRKRKDGNEIRKAKGQLERTREKNCTD